MKYEKSCGAVVFTKINNEIRYVLVQQSEGFHGFPKGHMEDGETEEQTAVEAYNTFEYESSRRSLKEANDFLNS